MQNTHFIFLKEKIVLEIHNDSDISYQLPVKNNKNPYIYLCMPMYNKIITI